MMPKQTNNRNCRLWWCNNKHYANDLCQAHYRRNVNHGHPIGTNVEIYRLAEAVNELREALFNSYEEKTMPGEVERILQLTTDGAVAPNPSICKTCNTSIGIWRNGNYIIVKCKCATIGIGIDRILKMRDDLT